MYIYESEIQIRQEVEGNKEVTEHKKIHLKQKIPGNMNGRPVVGRGMVGLPLLPTLRRQRQKAGQGYTGRPCPRYNVYVFRES